MRHEPETESDRAPRTYQGGCLCGTVRFHVQIAWSDAPAGEPSVWERRVPPERLCIVRGEGSLSGIELGVGRAHDFFCERCGVRVYSSHRSGGVEQLSLDIKLLERPIARLEPAPHADGAMASWARGVLRCASTGSCRAR